MRKEIITNLQGVILLTMFIFGSTVILGLAGDAKQDIWLAIIIAIAAAIPILLVYAKLLIMYPGLDLFEIIENIFGAIIGKIISVFFILYFIHFGSLVFRNFSGFISIVGLQETPELITVFLMGILCIWVVREGVEVLGRWAQFIFPIIAMVVFFLVTLSFINIDFNNFKPFLYNGFYPLFKGSFNAFIFPFTQVVVFLMVLNHLKEVKKSFKVFMLGLLIGGGFVFVISLRNLLVLGSEYKGLLYFATYEAVSLIKIGDFLQRFEAFVSVIFLFTGFIKISLCLLAASKGVQKLFNLKKYQEIVAPIGLLMMISSAILFDNFIDFSEWISNIYIYYALPFHVILPIIILLAAQIKIRLLKKKTA